MTSIYHITHLNNLERIIQANGPWCDAERVRQQFESVGIAHQTLKDRRARTVVAVGGTLADYVPFYFANRSPMLYSIHTGYVAGYDSGQKDIIYLLSTVERIAQGDRRWCFTDGHAVEALTQFFCDTAGLNQVDWAVIDHWSWKNTDQDPDRKRRKQAEFLIHLSLPWDWIEGIGVIDAAVGKKVATVTAKAKHKPPIIVQPKRYY
jgi:hypothetical protein